ncbi:MAG: SurA N-terminal domain-containing protein [Candidatus Nomurabacteria bacterium]|jgi:hypothetical protein|nr:SurA N-terminal domain-containing protein [Candidatus Nomurabacteria bacterium]
MKNKMIKKLRRKEAPAKPTPITSKNIDEHREEILKEAKKFKYPLQYARHKVLINTIIVLVVALIIFGAASWFALYQKQARGDFFYTLTRVFPVPVATVDGHSVKYENYLLRLRSSLHYLQAGGSEVDLNSEDGEEYIEHIKRQELVEAEKNALVYALASENDIAVSDEEVTDFINDSMKTTDASLSLQAFEKTVLNDLYGQSLLEFRSLVHDSLLRSKVMLAIDTDAKSRAEKLLSVALSAPDGFAELVKVDSDDEAKASGGIVEVEITDNINDPNGIIATARSLEKNAIAKQLIVGTDGYYIVKLNDKNDKVINYSILKIALKEFDKRYELLRENGKVKEFIAVSNSETE